MKKDPISEVVARLERKDGSGSPVDVADLCEAYRELERKQKIDQEQCDIVTSEAGRIATELAAANAGIVELETENEANAWKVSPAMAEARIDSLNEQVAALKAKVKRADDILLEVWGAYNRIGDALKVSPKEGE